MWHEGVIAIPQQNNPAVPVRYKAKVYDEGSKYGIEGGHISKLWMSIYGQEVASYDRGWDMTPTEAAAMMALEILLYEYN